MQRYIFILILCLHVSTPADSQNADRERFLNETVYRLSMEEKWDSVLYFCNLADYEYIETYEITYNRGRALFAKEQYREAWAEFEKAAEKYSPASGLKTYLYYSACYSGMDQRARYWRFKMSADERLKNKSGYIPFLENASVGYTIIGSQNIENNGSLEFYPPDPATFDSSSWYKMIDDMQSVHASFGFGLNKRIGLSLTYSSLSTNDLFRTAYIEYGGAPLSYMNYPSATNQQSLYISLPLLVGKRVIIEPAYQQIDVQTVNLKEGSTAGEVLLSDTSFTENLAALAFVFERSKATRLLLFSWSSFSLRQQLQASFVNTWYPGFNLNEYYTLSFIAQSDNGRPGVSAGFSAGWRINRLLWTEAGFRFGRLSNYNEMNGMFAVNNSDINNFLVHLNPIVLITPHVSLNLHYGLYINHLPYSLDDGSFSAGRRQFSGITLFKTNYLQHYLTGGITWKL